MMYSFHPIGLQLKHTSSSVALEKIDQNLQETIDEL